MNSLSNEIWDVLIVGTSLPQSLLALSLSKSDLKILHIDRNQYYGGGDAALSIDEAKKWADAREDATVEVLDSSLLAQPRAYTLSLRPQIIYAKSNTLPALVSSQLHHLLEFQAVGSTFLLKDGRLRKIPSSREDVFADAGLSTKDKRKLMGLLRYVLEEQDKDQTPSTPLADKLKNDFNIPDDLVAAVLALTLTTTTAADADFATTVSHLRRHLQSMGHFGSGVAAVAAKYGGNAEIAQVACRACAVGGGVYLLGHGLQSAHYVPADKLYNMQLTNEIPVRANIVVGDAQHLSPLLAASSQRQQNPTRISTYLISIVSNPLSHFFTTVSDDVPNPAVVIVLVDDGGSPTTPIYLQIHSGDTGECPREQCVIYASTINSLDGTGRRLAEAVSHFLTSIELPQAAEVLWQMQYSEQSRDQLLEVPQDTQSNLLVIPNRDHAIALDDTILTDVKSVYSKVHTLLGIDPSYEFMKFPARSEGDG